MTTPTSEANEELLGVWRRTGEALARANKEDLLREAEKELENQSTNGAVKDVIRRLADALRVCEEEKGRLEAAIRGEINDALAQEPLTGLRTSLVVGGFRWWWDREHDGSSMVEGIRLSNLEAALVKARRRLTSADKEEG